MATYLLIHGAWHGGWCWARVSDLLRKAGHTVFTPTLTGLGERAHLAMPDTDLECHINDVLGVVEAEELQDVILCGHSYGGQVITPVLDRQVEKFRAGIWLDAFIAEDGHSLMDGWPPERAQHIREQVATDRPAGIAGVYRALASKLGDDAHAVEHEMIECLAETLWEAQSANRAPDEQNYIERLRRLLGQRL